MESQKILLALLDHPGATVKQLVARSGAKQNTVQSLLGRYREALEIGKLAGGSKRGQPEKTYAVKPDWEATLRARAQPTAQSATMLQSTLGLIETASLAAFDPLDEDEESRAEMFETARLNVE